MYCRTENILGNNFTSPRYPYIYITEIFTGIIFHQVATSSVQSSCRTKNSHNRITFHPHKQVVKLA